MSINLNEMPKLGFGLMRLPEKDGAIDLEHVCRMVDKYMQAGLNYFDTAYVYHGGKSEVTAREAVVKIFAERHLVVFSCSSRPQLHLFAAPSTRTIEQEVVFVARIKTLYCVHCACCYGVVHLLIAVWVVIFYDDSVVGRSVPFHDDTCAIHMLEPRIANLALIYRYRAYTDTTSLRLYCHIPVGASVGDVDGKLPVSATFGI